MELVPSGGSPPKQKDSENRMMSEAEKDGFGAHWNLGTANGVRHDGVAKGFNLAEGFINQYTRVPDYPKLPPAPKETGPPGTHLTTHFPSRLGDRTRLDEPPLVDWLMHLPMGKTEGISESENEIKIRAGLSDASKRGQVLVYDYQPPEPLALAPPYNSESKIVPGTVVDLGGTTTDSSQPGRWQNNPTRTIYKKDPVEHRLSHRYPFHLMGSCRDAPLDDDDPASHEWTKEDMVPPKIKTPEKHNPLTGKPTPPFKTKKTGGGGGANPITGGAGLGLSSWVGK